MGYQLQKRNFLSPVLSVVLIISVDGRSACLGMNLPVGDDRMYNANNNLSLKKSETEYFDLEQEVTEEKNKFDVPSPSICFLDLHTLKVFHVLRLGEGQNVTALVLNNDNTNLLVSTADKQLIVFTDPALSLKVVDQMLKLGWEGERLSPLIK